MADTVGVSKSEISRETIAAGERLLKELAEGDCSKLDVLTVWIDGIQLGSYHVICAVGVDDKGHKHVLGIREGATENAEVAKSLLEELVARGLDVKRRRLFVIDGSKALRKAIDQVFGAKRRCNAAATTSFAMCSAICPRTNTTKRNRRSRPRSSSTRRKGGRRWRSTPSGWNASGRARRRRCEKDLKSCSRSIALASPARCVAVLGRRTSSTTVIRRFATEFAE